MPTPVVNPLIHYPWSLWERGGVVFKGPGLTPEYPWIAYNDRGELAGCTLAVLVRCAVRTTESAEDVIAAELGAGAFSLANLWSIRMRFHKWIVAGPREGRYDCAVSRSAGRIVFAHWGDRPRHTAPLSLRDSQVLALAEREKKTGRHHVDIIRDAIDAYLKIR